ncbi:MAG: deoxyribose-phosphate aldolase [Paracoccaceae bacterium]
MPLDKNYIKAGTNKVIVKNNGVPLQLDIINEARVNKSAVEKRCASVTNRRTVKKHNQAAWLLKAITCMDLTTLSGDDTERRVIRLCNKAKTPLRHDLLKSLGIEASKIKVGGVCVYHQFIKTALNALQGSTIPVVAVSTGFPAGHTPKKTKILEIKESIKSGAQEIDIVISRRHVLSGNWKKLYDEISEYKEASGESCLKTILATGELGTLKNVIKASLVCMMAGANFIKTSTGKENINATLPFTLVMSRAIREYFEHTGFEVGYKPAGGISSAKDCLSHMMLIKEELGSKWLHPSLFRLGASSLLSDIERQIEHFSTGQYSSFNRHGIA